MLAALAVPAVASAHPANISSARAYDASIGGSVLGTDTGLISRPGTNPPANDPFTVYKTAGTLPLSPLLEASLLVAKVHTANELAQAEATVAQAYVIPLGLTGKLLTSTASATCIGGRAVLGGSVLGTLTIGGNTYNLGTSPNNVVIPLAPLVTVTLNEQIKSGSSITVNAVDVDLLGTHIIVASSRAGVTNCALG